MRVLHLVRAKEEKTVPSSLTLLVPASRPGCAPAVVLVSASDCEHLL